MYYVFDMNCQHKFVFYPICLDLAVQLAKGIQPISRSACWQMDQASLAQSEPSPAINGAVSPPALPGSIASAQAGDPTVSH